MTGTVSGVHGTHIFIRNDAHDTIYAHRDMLAFSDPHIGLDVEFDLVITPEMRSPQAADVRRL